MVPDGTPNDQDALTLQYLDTISCPFHPAVLDLLMLHTALRGLKNKQVEIKSRRTNHLRFLSSRRVTSEKIARIRGGADRNLPNFLTSSRPKQHQTSADEGSRTPEIYNRTGLYKKPKSTQQQLTCLPEPVKQEEPGCRRRPRTSGIRIPLLGAGEEGRHHTARSLTRHRTFSEGSPVRSSRGGNGEQLREPSGSGLVG